MQSFKTFLLFLIFISVLHLKAQELPPINIFTTEAYGAENQNWAISQAENKFIYVANNNGLLEYNGATWQLYPSPNETIIRSVKAFENKIFTGFYMDFGYWQKNDFGVLEYTSIAKKLNIELLEDEQIWNIVEVDGWMIFKSLERIYLYNIKTQTHKIIQPEDKNNKIIKLTKVDGTIYFQEINKGIFKIENGLPKMISDDQILQSNILIDIFKKDDSLLFLTQDNGFFILKGNELTPWEIPANNRILNKTFYSARQLQNNDIVLGTISDGFIYLNHDGTFNYQITQSSGLSNNTILSVFEDTDQNIWLGLDNGINCINSKSPFKIHNNRSGSWGTIYASIVFGENLYLGTNQGLLCKKNNTDEDFKFIKNTQGQVWSLKIIDNQLFCGHHSGTFLIKDNKASKIVNVPGTWDIKKVGDNTLLQGNYDGLYIVKKKGGRWILNNKIEGFSNSSRYFELTDTHKIFVNHEYKDVFKLTINEDFTKVITSKKETSISRGIHSGLVKYQNNIYYGHKKGVYKYKEEEDRFVIDTLYSKLFDDKNFSSGKLINDAASNKLWAFSKYHITYLTPGKLSNKPIFQKIPIYESIRKGAAGYENITNIKNNQYLIGASNVYITIDLKSLKEPEDFNVYLNSIHSFFLDHPQKANHLKTNLKLTNEENNIEFFFSVPNFNVVSPTKYQYQLIGQTDHWSKPTEKNSILFENLPFGAYTFKVRGIVDGKFSTNEALFNFNIAKPWYVTNVMLLVYIVSLLLFSFIMHTQYKRYYRKQREELVEKAKKEAELKQLESEQEIIKLRNEKLRNDIESKNKELASSTMNIIKKNEFLNDIKTQLKNASQGNINEVISIIDKNLNNTDDWKLFQEAFNNADKGFLKKIKARHEDLTPNDLRLCAYLRLNLSSKEIAPLLNISPRSVEVKRYRLRKKMNLPHDSNLTNYILEI